MGGVTQPSDWRRRQRGMSPTCHLKEHPAPASGERRERARTPGNVAGRRQERVSTSRSLGRSIATRPSQERRSEVVGMRAG